MKAELWRELLLSLITATERGKITWKPTDSAGSVIAPFKRASITVRNVYPGLPQLSFGMTDVGHPIDLRNDDGDIVASLDDRGAIWATAAVISGLSGPDEFKLSTTADGDLEALVNKLVGVIRARGEAGALAAESIIDELE